MYRLIYAGPPFNSNQTYNLPFNKRKLKEVRPVEVFKNTWTWGKKEDEILKGFKSSSSPSVKKLADLVLLARSINDKRTRTTRSAAAYLCKEIIYLITQKSKKSLKRRVVL